MNKAYWSQIQYAYAIFQWPDKAEMYLLATMPWCKLHVLYQH